MTVTIRLRSVIWFVTGAVLALFAAWLFASAWSAEAAPGDSDTTTVPITSCRLVDTRPANQIGPRSVPLGEGDIYTVDVQNESTECAGQIPTSATGLVLNVTAAQTTAQTFLTVWDDGTWPGSSSMNPVPGPPVPNAVTTKLSSSNTFEIYNDVGSTHIIIDITAYLTPDSLTELDARLSALESANATLQSQVATLESEVATLEAKTAPMSIEDGGDTLRFSSVNVQVVDGSGDTTGAVNGLGNLIVGYNEDFLAPAVRPGSHNLVVGTDNDYSSFGGVVFGQTNTISERYATVTGGVRNTASGVVSSVSGGDTGTASNVASSVAGGLLNTASGDSSTVTGGSLNTANGGTASVSGGFMRTAAASEWTAGNLPDDS